MEINKLPNVNKHWVKDGYLNIELKTGDWIKLNFNNIQALKEQLTLTDVSQQRELLFCGGCGNKKQLIVETDINSQRVCKNKLCKQNNCG